MAGPNTNEGVIVTGGLFTVLIDFGPGAFIGQTNWLEIAVETNGASAFTTLTPRQQLAPVPSAIYAESGNAAGLSGTIPATSFGGTYGNAVALNNPGNSFMGSGAGLTALNASQLTSGTVPLAQLSGITSDQLDAATWQLATNLNGGYAALASNVVAGIAITNAFITNSVFAGDGSGLTNLNASQLSSGVIPLGQLPGAVVTNKQTSVILNGTFTGDGAGLTSLNANNLASGTVPLAQLSGITSDQLDAATWQLATNLNGGYAALASNVVSGIAITNAFITNSVFAGDGGGLTNLNASQLSSGTIPLGQLPAVVVTNKQTSVILNGTFTGDGAGLTSLNANNLASGTVPLGVLSGITGNQLDAATWQLATNLNGGNAALASNVVSGIAITNAFITNSVFAGDGSGLTNLNASQLSSGTIPLGQLPAVVVTNKQSSVILNGTFTGNGSGLTSLNVNASQLSGTVGNNQLANNSITVSAGTGLSGGGPVALGGSTALTNAGVLSVTGNSDITASTVGGAVTLGDTATNANVASTIVKRDANGNFSAGTVTATSFRSDTAGDFVAGGAGNKASGGQATVGGGSGNTASSLFATVGGGDHNTASAPGATVSGGASTNVASATCATVGGGALNQATNLYATVPGGAANVAGGAYSFAAGQQALATNQGAFVWADSQSAPFTLTASDQFLIRAQGGVGIGTNAPGVPLCVVGAQVGGFNGPVALVENLDTSGNSAPALRVVASGAPAYGALSVSTSAGFTASPTSCIATFGNQEQFLSSLDNNGNWTAFGNITGHTLVFVSDRDAKENFQPVSPVEVLQKVAQLPLCRWNYKNDKAAQHLGPTAQDLYSAFGLGSDDKHIATVDEGGVALAAIQGLNQKVEEREARIQEQGTEIEALQGQNRALAARLDELEAAVKALAERK